MTQDYTHPIAPPPELVKQWWEESSKRQYSATEAEEYVLAMTAGYAADKELEACCKWLVKQGWFSTDEHEAIEELRAARRPKPPSLKEQALEALDDVEFNFCTGKTTDIIRRALEQLPDPTSETHFND